jgi:Tfp pilus assembly protein PilE
MRMQRKNAEAGFNLIEAAIVLGIVGLIVGGIWAAASSAYENMRQQSGSKNLLSFAQSIRSFYANSGATSINTTVSVAITQGLVPADMVSGTAAMISPWGTAVTLGTGTIGSTNVFGILYSGLTQSTCINILTRNSNASQGSGLVAVAGIATMPTTATAFPLPVSGAGSASTLCAATTATNAPSFWFSIK